DAPAPPLRVGHAEDGVDRGDSSSGVPLLLAVEDEGVTVPDGPGLHAPGIRAGLLLRQPERDQALALCDVGKEAPLLLFGSRKNDGERTEGVDGVGHADAAARPGQLLDHEAEIQDASALAAVLLGNPDSGQVRLLQLFENLPWIGLIAVV